MPWIPRSLPPRKDRAQHSPAASVIDAETSRNQGRGVSHEISAPSPRLPSLPRNLPTTRGWSAKDHWWGWVPLIRPNRVSISPARTWSPKGSERVCP